MPLFTTNDVINLMQHFSKQYNKLSIENNKSNNVTFSRINAHLIRDFHSFLKKFASPNVDIYLLDDNGISLVAYEDTEHYRITKSFLDNPKMYFDMLFEE
jgi:hypothetical protein